MRFLVLLLVLAGPLPAAARELKYDDGKPDGTKSPGEIGCGTWFDGPLKADCVRIHAARGKAKAFDVAAFDRDGGVVAQAAFDGAALPEKADWVRLAFPLEADAGVLVVVTFNEGGEGELSWDRNEEQHSTWFHGGRHQPFDAGNWMIRLSTGEGARPLAFAPPALPATNVVRADRGEAFEIRRSAAGHAVRFARPAGQALAGFSIYAARNGRLARPFRVTVCDDRLRPVRGAEFPAGLIGFEEKWNALAMPPGPCPEAFWVVFDFAPTAADNVAVGVCRGGPAPCAEAKAGSVFRRSAAGEAWMVRAHFEAGEVSAPSVAAPPDESAAAVAGDIARKFFKALERCDRTRLASIVLAEAPGLDWVRDERGGDELDGAPHRKHVKEVAREIGADAATLVYAALDGPLLFDPPDGWRGVPEGTLLWLPEGPGRHARPQLFVLQLARTGEGWGLLAWEELDARDAAWGRGLLEKAPPLEGVLEGLAAGREGAFAEIEEEVRGLEPGAARDRLLVELARGWAEFGDLKKWEAIAKELPEEPAAMLRQTRFVEGKSCVAAGPEEKALRAAVEAVDALLPALEKRFGVRPEGRGKVRVTIRAGEESGWLAHPWTWSYPEVVWFATEEDLRRAPDPGEVAAALADACAAFWDDARQTRRWLAAGMMAEASLAGRETPAALAKEVADIPAARDTVGGHLRILVEASRRWGDAALGRALLAARRDGARRELAEGRLLGFDELAEALAKETGSGEEVKELFRR